MSKPDSYRKYGQIDVFSLLIMSMCLSVGNVYMSTGAPTDQNKASDPPELELEVVVCHLARLLNNELRFFARAILSS